MFVRGYIVLIMVEKLGFLDNLVKERMLEVMWGIRLEVNYGFLLERNFFWYEIREVVIGLCLLSFSNMFSIRELIMWRFN